YGCTHLEHDIAGIEERRVPPELVDDESADECSVFGGEERHRAVERGEHATALDVAHEQRWCVGVASDAHVHDVMSLEGDLGRTASPFGDDEIEARAKAIERAGYDWPELRHAVVVLASIAAVARPAKHNDLRRVVALRLEQDGIHVDRHRDSGRHGLHGLRAADFQTI